MQLARLWHSEQIDCPTNRSHYEACHIRYTRARLVMANLVTTLPGLGLREGTQLIGRPSPDLIGRTFAPAWEWHGWTVQQHAEHDLTAASDVARRW